MKKIVSCALLAAAVMTVSTSSAWAVERAAAPVSEDAGINVLPIHLLDVTVPVTLACNAVDVLGRAHC